VPNRKLRIAPAGGDTPAAEQSNSLQK